MPLENAIIELDIAPVIQIRLQKDIDKGKELIGKIFVSLQIVIFNLLFIN